MSKSDVGKSAIADSPVVKPDAFEAAVENVRPDQGDGGESGAARRGKRRKRNYPREKAIRELKSEGWAPPEGSGQAPAPASKPIDPAVVAQLLAVLSGLVCGRIGVTPLTQQELKAGGEAWAPIFDHYLPDWGARVGIWGGPLIWCYVVVQPRIDEYQAARELAAEERARELEGDGAEPKAPQFSEAAEGVQVESRAPAHLAGPVVKTA